MELEKEFERERKKTFRKFWDNLPQSSIETKETRKAK